MLSASAQASLSSEKKKIVGFPYWKTLLMALSLKGITKGKELSSTKAYKAETVRSPVKELNYSSNCLNKAIFAFWLCSAAIASSSVLTNFTSSLLRATELKILISASESEPKKTTRT